MEEEKQEVPQKGTDHIINAEPRVILGRWNIIVTIVLVVLSFLGGRYFESQESKKQIEQLQQQLKQEERVLEYSSEPRCALTFVSTSPIDTIHPHFLIKNLGPGQIDDVWLRETVFLVDSEGVHECLDLPHFEYIYYCGSFTSMGSLGAGEQKKIYLSPCWDRPFILFSRKFKGRLVSRFRLTGTALASPEFRKDFFFVIDRNGYEYISPEEFVEGKSLQDSVTSYIHNGPKSIIRWVSFADFRDFFKNPPRYFYQPDGKKYAPWDGPGLPPVSPATIPMYFSRYSVLPSAGGSVKLIWDCDSDGIIATMSSCESGVW